jgi:hypothetical protein
MTTFSATDPLEARVRFGAGTLTVETSDDGHATATVEPLDASDRRAVLLAEHSRIALEGTRLIVDVPGKGVRRSSIGVRVHLTVPARSSLVSQSGEITLTTHGSLGDVSVRTGSGDVRVADSLGAVDVKAGNGTVEVGTALRVGLVSGNGKLSVGTAGDVSLKAGQGRADLQSTSGSVVVKGGNVVLELKEALSGDVVFHAGSGSARVGVAKGTTVALDLMSGRGDVRCDLPVEASAPAGGAALRVRLRTGSGDVVVGPAVPPTSHAAA